MMNSFEPQGRAYITYIACKFLGNFILGVVEQKVRRCFMFYL